MDLREWIFLASAIVVILDITAKYAARITRWFSWVKWKATQQPTTLDGATVETKNSLKNVLGIGSILLALGNLALIQFGPARDAVLTSGDAASISVSLLLPLSGFSTLNG